MTHALIAFFGLVVLLLHESTGSAYHDKIQINFGACSCDPGWTCSDGRQPWTYGKHHIYFERPYILRGKRIRDCPRTPQQWRSFIHFSSRNKFCIDHVRRGHYFYEIIMGDCRANTYNMLSVNGQQTITHYQTNYTPKVFTGVVAVTDDKFCLWDPRKPLAHPNSLVEIVDGCGYPQPTRVSSIKLIYVPDKMPPPKCSPNYCVHGSCCSKNGITSCTCKDGWFGKRCNERCNSNHPCVHGTCGKDHVHNTMRCTCKTGWGGYLCNEVTAVIIREEKVWVDYHGKQMCLRLRKNSNKWEYYTYDSHHNLIEFQPPPDFHHVTYLNGERVVIKPRVRQPVDTHKIRIKCRGKTVTLLMRRYLGHEWIPYYKTRDGTWRRYYPPPGFSFTVAIGNDIVRIKPEYTYHKIPIVHAVPDQPRKKEVVYLMRVNRKWVPFTAYGNGLKSYHSPTNHHVIVTLDNETVHIKHKKPCHVSPCKNGGSCSDNGILFHCACPHTFSGNTCETPVTVVLPGCTRDTCHGHGKCVNLGGGRTQCHCDTGWSGTACRIPTSCPPLACSNGGVLINLGTGKHCQCPVGFTGPCCQHREAICKSNPCNSRGKCENVTATRYRCHCHYPYTGSNCHLRKKTMLCLINGRVYKVGEKIRQDCNRCACEETGHLVCTRRVCKGSNVVKPVAISKTIFSDQVCGRSPCFNGQCNTPHFRPRCRCNNGFTGPTCETVIKIQQVAPVLSSKPLIFNTSPRLDIPAAPVPQIQVDPGPQRVTKVGCDTFNCGYGSCNVLAGSPKCFCHSGWQGSRCTSPIVLTSASKTVTVCQNYPCENSGSCMIRNRMPYCLCATRYYGTNCEKVF